MQCDPNPLNGWAPTCYKTQFDEEYVLYTAKESFSALPVDVQSKYNADYLKAIDDLNKADDIFLAVCNSSTPPTPSDIDKIVAAVQAFLTALEPIFSTSSAGQNQMTKVHDEAGTMLKHLGR
jgi:hypothetical protein